MAEAWSIPSIQRILPIHVSMPSMRSIQRAVLSTRKEDILINIRLTVSHILHFWRNEGGGGLTPLPYMDYSTKEAE